MERSNLSEAGGADPYLGRSYLDVRSSPLLESKKHKTEPFLFRQPRDRQKGRNSEAGFQAQTMEALLLDAAQLEARAQKLGAKDSREFAGYRDWMAFQKAKYYETSAVMYHKEGCLQKAVGAILFVRVQGHVKWLWDEDYLAESTQTRLRQLWLSFLAGLLDKHNHLFGEPWLEDGVSLAELQKADMVWLYHFQKGFVPISRVLPQGQRFSVERFLQGPVARMMYNL
jgi:hypothetical protein